MKTKLTYLILTLAMSLIARGQGTAFTYQGRLNSGTNPATGLYDLRFAIYDGASAGTQQGLLITNNATGVTNGLFTVTLDFGNQFNGANRWLDIAVRTNGGGSFTTLSPRQALTPTPYAVTAANVVSGGIPAGNYGNAVTFTNLLNNFSGAFTGNGSGLSSVNASNLNGLTSANFWKTNGNTGADPASGAYLGTADNLPLEFKVNGSRVLRLEPNAGDAPNVVGGSSVNYVTPGVVGAVIAGGGTGSYYGIPYTNGVASDFGSVGGGLNNAIQTSAFGSVINGGYLNTVSGIYGTVGGGSQNTVATDYGTVGGGRQNSANNVETTVAGGRANNASGGNSSILGGYANTASGNVASVAGGMFNIASGAAALVAGSNSLASGYGAVAIGVLTQATNNSATALGYGTIAGGNYSTALGRETWAIGNYSTTMGYLSRAFGDSATSMGHASVANGGSSAAIGDGNYAIGYAALATGYGTAARGGASTAMGFQSTVNADYATAIGYNTLANGTNAIAMGSYAQASHLGSFVWADDSSVNAFGSSAANQFLLRASGGVGIGTTNPLVQLMVNGNTRVDAQTGVAYSEGLVINCPSNMTPAGGYGGIGFRNASLGAPLTSASVKWGIYYDYVAEGSAIGAGGLAFIQNNASTRLFLGTNGNVGIGNTSPNNLLVVGSAGSPAYCNGTTWVNGSDRNSKEAFAAINPRSVLEKVAALAISEWKYKVDGHGTRHIGPVAQDFHAAFGLNGTDDKHIATVDEEGVALAAIQGLNEKLEDRSQKLEEENVKLKARLEKLERLLTQNK
jgi:hypothetical protein